MLEDVIYVKFWEVQINLWVGIINFVEWNPHSQSGPWTPERLFLLDQSIRGCLLNILPGTLWVSEGCVRHKVTCAWAGGRIQKEPGLGSHLDVNLNPGSLTSLGWNLWTLLTSLSFRLVLGKTTSLFQGCLKDLNVYQMLGQHMGHMVEMQGNDHCYQPCQPVVPFNGKYKLEMQILGGGNSCCQLVFSGKFNLK